MNNREKITASFFGLVEKAQSEGIASAELFASVSGEPLTISKAGAIDRFLRDCAAEFRDDQIVADVVAALRKSSPIVAESLVACADEDGNVVGFLPGELTT